jgi:hypothetical protein
LKAPDEHGQQQGDQDHDNEQVGEGEPSSRPATDMSKLHAKFLSRCVARPRVAAAVVVIAGG